MLFGRKQFAAMAAVVLLSGCGLYIHDPSLQESAEATRTLVSEADLSKQINDELQGAATLARQQEAAVAGFYVMRRNQELLALLQPDVLEEQAFADTGDVASFLKSGSGYVRNPADLTGDIALAINCRLDELLAQPSPTCKLDRSATIRDRDTLVHLRNTSFPEIQFANTQGLVVVVSNARNRLLDSIAKAAAKDPSLPEDPRGKMACADIGPETREKARTFMPDPTAPDRVEIDFMSYAIACQNADLGRLQAEPLLEGNEQSALTVLSAEIDRLRAEREQQTIEGFRLATELKALLREIGAAQGLGPTEAALTASLQKAQEALKQATGIAKLAGLREVASKADELLQIELTKAAGAANAGAQGTPSDLTKTGQAVVTLATRSAAAIDAYEGKAPSARAQELIIARVALTQQIEVATLEAALTEAQLRLLIAKRDFMINEVHLLAESGLFLTRQELGSRQVDLSITRLAAAWDTGRIAQELITYRLFALQRDTAIRISATNAKNLQAAVLAATDQIVAYSKGGITKEAIADMFAKLFIGGALLK
jgi:hypothetical protein